MMDQHDIGWRRALASRGKIIRELLAFLWQERLWWLIPMVTVFLLTGILIVAVNSSRLTPFIYTLF